MASDRIIKFRAYHPVRKKMYYNVGISEKGHAFVGDEIFTCDECEVTEFTGLFDDYAKPIYERDIIQSVSTLYLVRFILGSYVLEKNRDALYSYTPILDVAERKVVGNYYEHGEKIQNIIA